MPERIITAQRRALKAEYDLIRQLHALLKREGDSLAAGRAAELPEIATAREKITASLQSMARTRMQSLQLAGIGLDVGSIRAYLESLPGRGPIRAAWNMLRHEYANLEQLNRANGAFIETQLRYLQTRWNGLLQCTGSTGLYSSKGKSPVQRAGNGLSAAA